MVRSEEGSKERRGGEGVKVEGGEGEECGGEGRKVGSLVKRARCVSRCDGRGFLFAEKVGWDLRHF